MPETPRAPGLPGRPPTLSWVSVTNTANAPTGRTVGASPPRTWFPTSAKTEREAATSQPGRLSPQSADFGAPGEPTFPRSPQTERPAPLLLSPPVSASMPTSPMRPGPWRRMAHTSNTQPYVAFTAVHSCHTDPTEVERNPEPDPSPRACLPRREARSSWQTRQWRAFPRPGPQLTQSLSEVGCFEGFVTGGWGALPATGLSRGSCCGNTDGTLPREHIPFPTATGAHTSDPGL